MTSDDAISHRRLAAILVADVVGFSRSMEKDEAGTLSILKERHKSIIEPAAASFGGRIVKLMGDGVLIEFTSAVNAVKAALELQEKFNQANEPLPEPRRFELRIGINLGDVVGEGNDIFGDGVNVAARLEALAEPEGICISAKVHDEIEGKVNCRFEEGGEHTLKNLSKPVRIYHLQRKPTVVSAQAAPALPDRPSIAVLPFVNFSTDPEQAYFADGLTEDLITDLSRNPGLFVIARNSSFAYKGKSIDVRQIAKELGVRYLLEGSARRAQDRVRINVQLIDAVAGGHLWAERFDRDTKDVFSVQDEVTAKIVDALVGRLTATPVRNRPRSLEAYDLCVRGRGLFGQTHQEAQEARVLLQDAIKLDPDYAEAHRWLALNLWLGWEFWNEPMRPNRSIALAEAEKAVALDPNDSGNHWALGVMLTHERRWSEADAAFATALQLDPNNADALTMQADDLVMKGQPADAIEQINKAMRLNPHPPGWYYWLLGEAQYALKQYEVAVHTLTRPETYRSPSRRILAASLAQLGRVDDARREAELFLLNHPHFRIKQWSDIQPFREEAELAHFVEGYRKAGLPE